MPIFDQGYQHWKGPLTGHAWRWLAVARHGVRVQMKGWLVRLLVLAAWLPAIALVVALAMWGLIEQQSESVPKFIRAVIPPDVSLDPRAYRSTVWTVAYSYFFQFEMYFIMVLVVIAGPGLISRDLRFNALPLYLSRPVTRFDYFLGKLGVIAALVATVAVVPAVVAYVLGVAFSFDLGVVKDTYRLLLGSVAYGLIVTASVGTLILAMSSLTRRSLYVGIAWAGMWIISGSVGPIMTGIHRDSVRGEAMDEGLSRWVADHPPPPGVQMRGVYPVTKWDSENRKVIAVGLEPGREKEFERWQRGWSEAMQHGWNDADGAYGAVAKRDWRPMFSYVANLERFADVLLDTDRAWVTFGRLSERPRAMLGPMFGPKGKAAPVSERRLADERVAQYPWEWSAGVLAALLGLSVWTLSRRVKSLDRLK
jgi:ABC-type transport system involved in multi-copper enzyme maturation permease subunit